MSNVDQVVETRTVVIAQGVRCVDEDGQVHADGATATVPLALAAEWIRAGWASIVEPSAPATDKAAPVTEPPKRSAPSA